MEGFTAHEVACKIDYSEEYDLPDCYIGPGQYIIDGSFGCVSSFYHSDIERKVAVKKICFPWTDKTSAKNVYREIVLGRALKNEHVILFIEATCHPEKDTFSEVYLVYECMETDLSKIIHHQNPKPLNEELIKDLLSQLMKGVQYLHSVGVLHRDLKPANLLIDTTHNTEGWVLKICDFGLSRYIGSSMTPQLGAPSYQAPEVISGDTEYTSAVDIWAVGCIFAEMLNKDALFKSSGSIHARKVAVSKLTGAVDSSVRMHSTGPLDPANRMKRFAEKFPTASKDALDLIGRMLVNKPGDRITAEEAIVHPFLAHYRGREPANISNSQLNCDVDIKDMTMDEIKECIWKECVSFNPDRYHTC